MFVTKLAGLAGLLAGLVAAQTTTLQAESATLSGVTVATAVAGYSGESTTSYFSTLFLTSHQARATSKASMYQPTRSPSPSPPQPLNCTTSSSCTTVPMATNTPTSSSMARGGSEVSLPSTTGWTTVSAGQALLNAGTNTIEIQSNWGWYLIDSIILSPSPKRGAHKISTTPVSPNANADAKALLKYIGSIYGKKILSGQQDQASLDWVTSNVGKTPAILGLDLMDYTESRISRGASSTDVDKAIAFSKKGGIVSFVWHWGAPAGLYDTAAQPWYSGFYTAATDFNIETALKVRLDINVFIAVSPRVLIQGRTQRMQTTHS